MKNHKFLLILAMLALLVTVNPVAAMRPTQSATLQTPGTSQTLVLPAAVSADNPVISLGSAVDPGTGKVVQGYAIVRYRPKTNEAKPPWAGGGGGNTTPVCYEFLGKNVKWKTAEPWVMNATNTEGLSEAALFAVEDAALAKWEDAADGTVGSGPGVDIVGAGSQTNAALEADMSAPDDVNEVYFADISEPDVIGVTIVWGVFNGPKFAKELVEWDQVFDDVDFDWSLSGEAGKMDFDNISTHENGHTVGMGDLYDSACSAETMYGYASNGETSKRSLEAGDITGISTLY